MSRLSKKIMSFITEEKPVVSPHVNKYRVISYHNHNCTPHHILI